MDKERLLQLAGVKPIKFKNRELLNEQTIVQEIDSLFGRIAELATQAQQEQDPMKKKSLYLDILDHVKYLAKLGPYHTPKEYFRP